MAHSEEIIKKLNNQLKHADGIIAAQKRKNDELQLQLADAINARHQAQHLLFAALHSLGPIVKIRVDNFLNYMENATMRGEIILQDEFPFSFIANLEFSVKGDFSDIPEPTPTQE